jgi:hypothetical protein
VGCVVPSAGSGRGGPAKPCGNLDQLYQVRYRGGPGEDTAELMRAFSEILVSPPEVEILRVHEVQGS